MIEDLIILVTGVAIGSALGSVIAVEVAMWRLGRRKEKAKKLVREIVADVIKQTIFSPQPTSIPANHHRHEPPSIRIRSPTVKKDAS